MSLSLKLNWGQMVPRVEKCDFSKRLDPYERVIKVKIVSFS